MVCDIDRHDTAAIQDVGMVTAAGRPAVAMCAGTSWYIWNFRRNVVKAFSHDGWQVVLIAPEDESTERLAKIPGVGIQPWRLSLDGAKATEEISSLWQVIGALKRHRPDFVLNNGIKANVYAGIACRLLRIPYVNNVSGLGTRMTRSGLGAYALARLYSLASTGGRALMIQNEADLDFLYSRGLSRKIPIHRTMGSGVDLDHFFPSPMPDGSGTHFVFVGRLQRDKGIHDFVEAARILRNESPDAQFTVVGDKRHTNSGGVDENELHDWQEQQFIEFVGRQDDVRPWLAGAHVLVMPSHGGEGMPKVILEAAACGRPVITSNTPGCRDAIVPGETGWLHAPGDIAGLVSTMREASGLPRNRLKSMGLVARQRAESLFSEKKISDLALRLANSALADHKA